MEFLYRLHRAQYLLFSELISSLCACFTAKACKDEQLRPLTVLRAFLWGRALRTKFLVAKCQRTH